MSFLFDTDLDALNALYNRQGDPSGVDASMERLKAGIRIKTVTELPDGGTEALRAQINAMNQSIAATQTMIDQFKEAEGELSRINYLIDNIERKVRDVAEDTECDQSTARCDQAEIRSALRSIDRIAQGLRANRKVWWAGPDTGMETDSQNSGEEEVSVENSVSLSLPSLNTHSLGLTSTPGCTLANIDVTTPNGASRALHILSAASATVDSCWEQIRSFRREALQPVCNTMCVRVENISASLTTVNETEIGQAAVDSNNPTMPMQRDAPGFYMASKLPAAFLQML